MFVGSSTDDGGYISWATICALHQSNPDNFAICLFTAGSANAATALNRPTMTAEILLTIIPPPCRTEHVVRQMLAALHPEVVVFHVKPSRKRPEQLTVTVSASHAGALIALSRFVVCTPTGMLWALNSAGSESLFLWVRATHTPVVAIELAATTEGKRTRKRDALTKDLMTDRTSSRCIVCPTCKASSRGGEGIPLVVAILGKNTAATNPSCHVCNQRLFVRDMTLYCSGCGSFTCLACIHELAKFAYDQNVLDRFQRANYAHTGELPSSLPESGADTVTTPTCTKTTSTSSSDGNSLELTTLA